MTSIINVQKNSGKSISRGLSPKNAAMLQLNFDFAVDLNLQFSANFSEDIQNQYGIAGIQSVVVDNTLNSDVLKIQWDNGYTLYIPPYSEGIYPVFWAGQQFNFQATATVVCTVTMYFVNTRENAMIWNSKLPIAGVINVSGSQIFTQKTQAVFTGGSLATVANNTAIQIFAANANRKMLSIRNPGTDQSQNVATENAYIIFGTAGAQQPNDLGTWELFPGEQLPQFEVIPTSAISVVCATLGHRITAFQA